MDRNIIFGPPGTGKTTHLLRIVEKELRENNVAPNRIAYLAFTNQAADEALSRAVSQLNYRWDVANIPKCVFSFRSRSATATCQRGPAGQSLPKTQKEAQEALWRRNGSSET